MKKVPYFLLGFCILLLIFFSWEGLSQPLYWDSLGSLLQQSVRIHRALSELVQSDTLLVGIHKVWLSLLNTESDYPHTFGTALFYSFLLFLPHTLHFVAWHGVSLVISVTFLLVFFAIVKKKVHSKAAVAFVALFVTNPLFLAQTVLVYHEIPGTLLRYVSLYFLIEKKILSFLVFALLAFFVRFENGPLLFLFSLFYLLTSNVNQFVKKNLIKSIIILGSSIFAWFFAHKLSLGWFLINPEFGHSVNALQAVEKTTNFLFIEQGRWLVTTSSLLLTLFTIKTLKAKLKLVVGFLLLLLPVFAMVMYLGTSLPRYIFSVLPLFYGATVFLAARAQIPRLIKILLFSVVFYLQLSHVKTCAPNFETCLKVVDWISVKKEIGSYLETSLPEGAVVYANWDETLDFSRYHSKYGWFCSKCVKMSSYEDLSLLLTKSKEVGVNNYFLVTPNTSHNHLELLKATSHTSVKQFSSKNLNAELFVLAN